MDIKHIDGSYICYYENCVIKSLTAQYNPQTEECNVEVVCSNGAKYNWKCREIVPGYIGLYGLAVSEDGSRVFVPTWNKGLYCLDITNGKKLWRVKKIFKAVISKNNSIICLGLKHISKYDYNGLELLHYKCLGDYAINEKCGYVIAAVKRGYYSIFNIETLKIVMDIKASQMKISSVISIDIIKNQFRIRGFGFDKYGFSGGRYVTYFVDINSLQI